LDIVRKYKLHKMDSWNESFDSILTIMTKFLSTQNQYSSLVQVLIWINIATRWGGGVICIFCYLNDQTGIFAKQIEKYFVNYANILYKYTTSHLKVCV
jgi:hypothetical protein